MFTNLNSTDKNIEIVDQITLTKLNFRFFIYVYEFSIAMSFNLSKNNKQCS